MTARDTMTDRIADLRARADAGTADYDLSGVTYWDDEVLQAVLDRHREDVTREALVVTPVYENGTLVYRDYAWARPDVETADGGTVWRVETSAGSLVGTADYTINYDARRITFDADQGGTAYLLSYRAYDMDAAEADVWQRKAAHVASRIDIQTDNHDLKRSQLFKHYGDMARQARGRARPKAHMLRRGDLTDG